MSTISRRQFFSLAGLGVLGLGASACSSGTEAAQNTSTEFVTNGPAAISPKAATPNPADSDGVLTVGFDAEFPPYGYIGDDGKFTGVDLELAAETAARNGWDLNCNPIAWDAKDAELEAGTIDCIWNGFTMTNREDGYTFTDPTTIGGQAFVVLSDSPIQTLADLEGKTVLVQTDSASYDLLKEGGKKDELGGRLKALQTIADYNTAMMELESGAVDAVAMGLDAANYQLNGKEDKFRILDEMLSEEYSGVGFLKGNTVLRDAIQQTLIEMTADGTVEKIYANYEGQGISYSDWILGK